MATLVELYNLWKADGGALTARFIGACLVAAHQISGEDPGTPNHVNRVLWANAILSGVEATVTAKATEILRYAIASNATLQSQGAGVTDNDVQFIVNGLIDTFATGA